MDEADAYQDTVKRLEPDIHPIDTDAGLASIAISLRRIADALESLPERLERAIQTGMWLANGGGR